MEKTGPSVPLAREAAALRDLAGLPGVPRVLAAGVGRLETVRLPGAPRAASRVSREGWGLLGALLYRVHHHGPTAQTGEVPQGDRLVPADATEFAALRVAAVRDAAVAAGLDIPLALPAACPRFVRVHGDLTVGNIVWDGDVPGLVDWEFSRFGDPAEDLAGLVAVNRLGRPARAVVRVGYGDDDTWARVAGWEPVVRLEAAAWWRAHGRDDLAARVLGG